MSTVRYAHSPKVGTRTRHVPCEGDRVQAALCLRWYAQHTQRGLARVGRREAPGVVRVSTAKDRFLLHNEHAAREAACREVERTALLRVARDRVHDAVEGQQLLGVGQQERDRATHEAARRRDDAEGLARAAAATLLAQHGTHVQYPPVDLFGVLEQPRRLDAVPELALPHRTHAGEQVRVGEGVGPGGG